MERGPILTSAKLWICGVYLPSVRAYRLSRRIAAMERAGDAGALVDAREQLAHLVAGKEFAEEVLDRERGGD